MKESGSLFINVRKMYKNTIAIFADYDRVAGSSDYHSCQCLNGFEDEGYAFKVKPIFNYPCVARECLGKCFPLKYFMAFFFSRLWSFLTVSCRSFFLVEYELLPFFPVFLEPCVVDTCGVGGSHFIGEQAGVLVDSDDETTLKAVSDWFVYQVSPRRDECHAHCSSVSVTHFSLESSVEAYRQTRVSILGIA